MCFIHHTTICRELPHSGSSDPSAGWKRCSKPDFASRLGCDCGCWHRCWWSYRNRDFRANYLHPVRFSHSHYHDHNRQRPGQHNHSDCRSIWGRLDTLRSSIRRPKSSTSICFTWSYLQPTILERAIAPGRNSHNWYSWLVDPYRDIHSYYTISLLHIGFNDYHDYYKCSGQPCYCRRWPLWCRLGPLQLTLRSSCDTAAVWPTQSAIVSCLKRAIAVWCNRGDCYDRLIYHYRDICSYNCPSLCILGINAHHLHFECSEQPCNFPHWSWRH